MTPAARVAGAVAVVALVGCGRDAPPTASPSVVVDTFASTLTVPFETPVGVVVLPGRGAAIVDAKASRVFVLRADGTLERTIGRPGAGPGELRRPGGITRRGDTLMIFNVENGRIERFLLDGSAAGSTPLPAHAMSENLLLLSGDTMLITTGGRDSALARLVTAAGYGGTRYGSPVVPPVSVWDFVAMKKMIRDGHVPAELRNLALPAVGPGGDVWLALQSEGRIEHYDRAGVLRGIAVVPDSDLAPLRSAFLRANTDDNRPSVLRPLLLASSAAADSTGAWFLLARSDSLAAVLLRVDRAGAITRRISLPGVYGAWQLAWDAPRRTFYLVVPSEGAVLRARVAD